MAEKRGKNAYDGIDVATKEVTLTSDLLVKFPNVRDWRTEQATLWLEDIFAGAEDLPRYVAEFRKLAVNGVDLLFFNEEQLKHLVASPIHLGKMKACIAQLVVYQRNFDLQATKKAEQDSRDSNYIDLKNELLEKTKGGTPYEFPDMMRLWKPLDVFAYVSSPELSVDLSKFSKPFAIRRINGKELIDFASKNYVSKEEVKEVNNLFPGLEADSRDLKRFCEAVKDKERVMKEKAERLVKQERDAREKYLKPFNSSEVRNQVEIGSGYFGKVYRARFDGRNVAIKRPKLKDSSRKQRQQTPVAEMGKKTAESVRENEMDYPEMKKKYQSMVESGKDYPFPPQMSSWGPLDVFAFLSEANLPDFVRPFALKKVAGEELLALGAKSYATVAERDSLNALFPGLEADASDLKKFCDCVNSRMSSSESEDKMEELREDLNYEAVMLHKCAGDGVLQLIHVNASKRHKTLELMTEYLCRGSVEHEIDRASKGNEESIFHECYEKNLLLKEEGMTDPVLMQATRIAREVASALAMIHSRGIVHLDIAARNIFLDARRRPKIGDFGCAAFEKDMLEQHALHSEYPDGVDRAIFIDHSPNSARLKHTERLFTRERPARWMPSWVVDAGNPHNPLIDRKTDVYAFGCLMLEMYQKRIPHYTIGDEEVIRRKHSGQGNQILPSDMHKGYAAVINLCWQDYGSIPSMDEIASKLTDLHQALIREGHNVTASYIELRDLTNSAATRNPAQGATSGSSYSDLFSASSTVYSNLSDAAEANKSDRGNKSRTVDADSKYFNILPDRVRLKFPSHIDVNSIDDRFVEYQEEGIEKSQFDEAMRCSFRLRDHETIARNLECIFVDTRRAQVDAICQCLKFIEDLASDENGYTDVDHGWKGLCESIMRVIQSAEESTPSTQPATPVLETILPSALRAFSMLLRKNEIADGNDVPSFGPGICDTVVNALRLYPSSSDIAESACGAIQGLAGLSNVLLEKLYDDGTLDFLVQALTRFNTSEDVVTAVSKAFSNFPMMNLLNPKPNLKDKQWTSVLDAYKPVLRRSRNKDVLEPSLLMLYRSCESSVTNPVLIEKFLSSADDGTIESLCEIIRSFPEYFRIQEGAIGLLSKIVSTGAHDLSQLEITNSAEIYNSGKSSKTGNKTTGYSQTDSEKPLTSAWAISMVAPAIERVDCLLRLDPTLDLIVHSMEMFSVDDQLSIGIERKDNDRNSVMTKGIFRSNTESKTLAKYSTSTVYKTTSVSVDDVLAFFENDSFEDFMVYDPVDEEGEIVTAGPLQRNAAVLIGACCSVREDLKALLQRHRHFELILLSFEHFKRDEALIADGCYALFSICRGNAVIQKSLHELQVVRRLLELSKFHDDTWIVLDGVICALIGLLEPPDDLKVGVDLKNPTEKQILEAKELLDARKKTYDGYRVAKQLTKNVIQSRSSDSMISLVQSFAVIITEFCLDPNCHPLIANFLKLLCSIFFWVPAGDVLKWNVSSPEMAGSAFFVRIHQIYMKCRQHVSNVNRLQKSSSSASTTTATTSTATSVEKSNKVVQAKRASADELASVVNSKEISTLVDFVMYCMMLYQKQPHVLAAGLAMITFNLNMLVEVFVGSSLNSVGAEIPYAQEEILSLFRWDTIERGGLDYCFAAIKSKVDNPILIRYTMWLIVLFISEKCHSDEDDTDFNDKTSAAGVAAEVALHHGIEWAIDVMIKYHNYYSLQMLSIHMLIWLEYHGRFSNRSIKKLTQLRDLLQANMTKPTSAYLKLKEEGHDTSLMGQSLEIFGSYAVHADRLLRLVESHLPKTFEEETVELWDGLPRPFKVTVTALAQEEDAAFRSHFVYVATVQWGAESTDKWRFSKRFNSFAELKSRLEMEFSHLPLTSRIVLQKSFSDKLKYSDSMHEERRKLIHEWFEELGAIPAVCHCHQYMDLIEVKKNRPVFRCPRKAPTIPTADPHFKLQATHFDPIWKLFFVAVGLDSISMFGSKDTLRGIFSVYTVNRQTSTEAVDWLYGGTSIKITVSLKLSAGAVAVSWDPSRRLVFLGLCDGPVVMYHLSLDNRTFTYCNEIAVHTDKICRIIFDPIGNVVVTGAQNGSFSVFDLKESAVVAQCPAKPGTRFMDVAFDANRKFVFGATNLSSICVFNAAVIPVQLVCSVEVSCPSPNPEQKFEVCCISFEQDSRFLFAAFRNTVQIFVASDTGALTRLESITMAPTVKINSLVSLNDGKHVMVSDSRGAVAVYDLWTAVQGIIDTKEKDANEKLLEAAKAEGKPVYGTVVSTSATTASAVGKLSSSVSQVLTWNNVIKSTPSAMRDWLRAVGVNCSSMMSKTELILAIANHARTGILEAAEALRPAFNIKAMFAWNINVSNMCLNRDGSIEPFTPRQQPRSITTLGYVSEIQGVICGCDDGSMEIVSLSDFFIPFDKKEAQLLLSLYNTPEVAQPKVAEQAASTRGKRHQL